MRPANPLLGSATVDDSRSAAATGSAEAVRLRELWDLFDDGRKTTSSTSPAQ
jgi:hypothetical protein